MLDPVRTLFGDDSATAVVRERLGGTVQIELADPSQWDQQILLLALVDLLRRVLPSVEVVLESETEAHPSLPNGRTTLIERVTEVSDYGCETSPAGAEPAAVIVVGARATGEESGAADIHVSGSGWISYLGLDPGTIDTGEGMNPVGPLAAACRASSAVLGLLLGEHSPWPPLTEPCYWDALDNAPPSASPPKRAAAPLHPRLKALLMGCGSIGGAAAYTWARVPDLAGELSLLDPQTLQERNRSKAILARPHDVAANTRKADVAEAELAAHVADLDVKVEPISLADFVAGRPREQPLPLVLCAVDSVESRRELQDCLPLEVINAACGANDINLSGHVTDNGPCVYCLHIERVLDREQAQISILVAETGMPPQQIAVLISQRAPLEINHLRGIERHRQLEAGALDHQRGRTLEQLFRDEILYSEQRIDVGEGGQVAIPAPHVSALAGILLAGEALKACQEELAAHRLGPYGSAIKYAEDLTRPGGLLSNAARYPGPECLCNDPRRLRLLRERHQLSVQATGEEHASSG